MEDNCKAYLPGTEDALCGSPRARPFHCTSDWLTPVINPNVVDFTLGFISLYTLKCSFSWDFSPFAKEPTTFSDTEKCRSVGFLK